MKNIGIIMVVVGALILVFSYAADKFLNAGTTDMNCIQIIAMALIIAAIPVHIHVIGKKSKA